MRTEAMEIASELNEEPSLQEQHELLRDIINHMKRVALNHGYKDWVDYYNSTGVFAKDDEKLSSMLRSLAGRG